MPTPKKAAEPPSKGTISYPPTPEPVDDRFTATVREVWVRKLGGEMLREFQNVLLGPDSKEAHLVLKRMRETMHLEG